MFKKTTLSNGLRIITVPQKEARAATVLILIKTGSKYEEKANNGISHFLEHMFFKGTKKRPSSKAVAEFLDKIGGIYNAFTSQDFTGYFAKVEASQFNLALDWVSDIFLNSTLPKSEIKKEKGVIIEEVNMFYDTPMSYIQTLWSKVLYGDQPAGWDIAGNKENIKKMNYQKLLDYKNKQYVAENTIVCVAGKIEESLVIKKIKKYFSKIKTTKGLEKPKVFEKQTKPAFLSHYKKTDQTHLCLGVRGYNLFHPQRFSLEILGTILGGMMSSRLFVEIRERLGIAYYIKTNIEADPDTGSLVTQVGVDNKNVEKAILTILKEYKKISQKKVPVSEFKKAKDNMKGKLALLLESSDAQASFYAGQEVLEEKILTPKEIFAKIDKVKASELLKTAKDIFKPEKLNLALIGPHKDKKRFQRLLKL